jgi:hypothetical protein
VLITDRAPPTFELSDPAIHYASSVGKERVLGDTDLRKEGMELFSKTHECSPVCKYTNLSREKGVEATLETSTAEYSGRRELERDKSDGCVVS